MVNRSYNLGYVRPVVGSKLIGHNQPMQRGVGNMLLLTTKLYPKCVVQSEPRQRIYNNTPLTRNYNNTANNNKQEITIA